MSQQRLQPMYKHAQPVVFARTCGPARPNMAVRTYVRHFFSKVNPAGLRTARCYIYDHTSWSVLIPFFSRHDLTSKKATKAQATTQQQLCMLSSFGCSWHPSHPPLVPPFLPSFPRARPALTRFYLEPSACSLRGLNSRRPVCLTRERVSRPQ